MDDRPQVDVGVVTYNTRDLSVSALRRLLDSDNGCQIRLLVRDNGSTDGTAEAVARLIPEADLDAGTDNVGFAAGVNSLIARSGSPWFFALNSDAWPLAGALGTLVAAAAQRPGVAAVAPRLRRPDGQVEHSTHPFPSLRVAAVFASGAYHLLPRPMLASMMLEPAWQHDRPRQVDWAVGAALLMRRSALDQVGGFDERFFMYAEDLEWCWRAHKLNWSIWFEPAAEVIHVGNASGHTNYGTGRTDAYMRNTYRFYRREHGAMATMAYRSLNFLASSRAYVMNRARRDPSTAWWAEQARAHLVRTAGPDGPPPPGPDAPPPAGPDRSDRAIDL